MRAGIAGSHMITVVRKMGTRGQSGGFANDFVAFHNQLRAVGVFDDPLSAQQRDRSVGIVANRQVVDEGVRSVGRQLFATVPVDEFIQFNTQARQFEWGGHRAG